MGRLGDFKFGVDEVLGPSIFCNFLYYGARMYCS